MSDDMMNLHEPAHPGGEGRAPRRAELDAVFAQRRGASMRIWLRTYELAAQGVIFGRDSQRDVFISGVDTRY